MNEMRLREWLWPSGQRLFMTVQVQTQKSVGQIC